MPHARAAEAVGLALSVQPHGRVGMSDALGRPAWLDPVRGELPKLGTPEPAPNAGMPTATVPKPPIAWPRAAAAVSKAESEAACRGAISRTYHARNRKRWLAEAPRVGRAGLDVPCGATILGFHWPSPVEGCSRRGWVAQLTTLAGGTEAHEVGDALGRERDGRDASAPGSNGAR